jgi:diadenosine tetraphosphate (Ap4A) HIT family hydrolase
MYKYHYLIISKRHIKNVWHLQQSDGRLVSHMRAIAQKALDLPDLQFGFHSPYITQVNHLHMHAIGGAPVVPRIVHWFKMKFWIPAENYSDDKID